MDDDDAAGRGFEEWQQHWTEAHDRQQMRGYDQANSLREYLTTASRDDLEVLYHVITNVTVSKKMGTYYLGLIAAILDLQHGVSLADGRTDEERLRDAGIPS